MPDNEENINENESQNESQNESSSNDDNNQVASSNDYIYDEETHQWRLRTENDPEPSDVELIILEGTDVTDGINRASDRITAAVNENLDVRSGEILSAFGAAQKNSLKEEIIAEVIERLKPEGHVYPDTSLFPEWMTPNIHGRYYGSNSWSYIGAVPQSVTARIFMDDPNNIKQFNVNNTTYDKGWTEEQLYEIEHLDISRFQSLNSLFASDYFKGLYSSDTDAFKNMALDLSNWDTSNVKSFYNLFYCYSGYNFLKSLNMSGWDVRKASTLDGLFRCYRASGYQYTLHVDNFYIEDWDVRNISSMREIFFGLVTPVLDLSSWNLSYVNDFSYFIPTYIGSTTDYIKILWGGSCNADLHLATTHITPENAELFFQSLSPKMTNNTVTITMPSTAQGADVSIATNKGYTIAGITAP